MERFLTEYANYEKKLFKNNKLMQQEYKDKAIERINKILQCREKGLITIDETINGILNCLPSN
jgi:hypothetical protein